MSGGGIPGYETPREAADRIGISASQARRLCALGRWPGAVKVGRQWLVPEGSTPEEAGFGRPPTWAKDLSEKA